MGVEDGESLVAVAPVVSVPVPSELTCRGSRTKAEAPRKVARKMAGRNIEDDSIINRVWTKVSDRERITRLK